MHKTSYIKKLMYEKYHVDINEKLLKQLSLMVQKYEVRGIHSLALNTPLLATIDKKRKTIITIHFLDSDQQALFDLVGINRNTYKKDLWSLPSVDHNERTVASDPFNNLIVWLVHLVYNSKLNLKLRNEGVINLFKLMHYRFFSSFVNHIFKFGTNEAIMRKTIESLNNKYDIIKYGSWKKVIEVRSEDILYGKPDSELKDSKSSIHIETIKHYEPDIGVPSVSYLITDTLTRIKSRIKNIMNIFHKFKDDGEGIGDYELVTEIDGSKIITGTQTLESIITNLSSSILNTNTFINNDLITSICMIFKNNLKPYMFRSLLVSFSELAIIQSKSNELDKFVVLKKDKIIYEGTRILISNIIQKTYRFLILNKTNLQDRRTIIIKTKNLYSASRINDIEILNIKDSLDSIIQELVDTRRPATLASMKIAFILYIMIRSFDYL